MPSSLRRPLHALLAAVALLSGAAAAGPADHPARLKAVHALAARDLRAALGAVERLLEELPPQGCDPARVETTLVAAELHLTAQAQARIRKLLDSVASCVDEHADRVVFARYTNLAGFAEPNRADGLRMMRAAASVARSLGEHRLLAQLLHAQGYILRQVGALDGAGEVYREAIRFAAEGHDEFLLARLYSDYSQIPRASGDHVRALQYVERALRLAHRTGASRLVAPIRINRALINKDAGNTAATERELRALATELAAQDNVPMLAAVLMNLSGLLNELGRPAESEREARRGLALAAALGDDTYRSTALANLGEALHLQGRDVEAVETLQVALDVSRKAGMTGRVGDLYQSLAKAYVPLGRYRQAYDALSRGTDLRQEAEQERRRQSLAEAQTRFDLERQQAEIESLNAELALKEEIIAQQSFIRRLTAALSALAIISLLLVLRLYYTGRRTYRRLRRRADALEAANIRDDLTAVYNRRYAERTLAERLDAVDAAKRPAVILIDIDHFKRLNDSEGHPFGDQVLKAIADRIQSALRRDDVLARWGGEEFCLLAAVANVQDAGLLLERVLNAVRHAPFEIDGKRVAVTCSAGCALSPRDEVAAADWRPYVELADIALYRAKGLGRNRAVYCQTRRAPTEALLEAIKRQPDALQADGKLTMGVVGAC